ncbi:MAG TPA: class I SAM-dependent methyltransferase [Candidatus Binatia bacterium]|nr:class I SAM-dependent methyltransferase [Candidatus Binatia bacterium]
MASLGDSVERRIDFVTDVETLAGPVRGRTVLDLGCGRHALWTRAYVARGARVVAVELDPARCREAQERLASAPPAGDGRVLGIARGDGERLPLASATADFIHCAQVLEHVRSPAAFLAELRRVLVPGGHAYVTAINRFAFRDPHFGVVGVNYLPRRVADRVLAAVGATNPEGQALSAMHYFSRAGFRRLCARHGLDTIVDLKRRERLARHGHVAGRLADAWGTAVRSAAFHVLVRARTA